jgi:hypothetical protein
MSAFRTGIFLQPSPNLRDQAKKFWASSPPSEKDLKGMQAKLSKISSEVLWVLTSLVCHHLHFHL